MKIKELAFGLWIPVMLGLALALFGWALSKSDKGFPNWAPQFAFGLAFVLFIIAFIMGLKSSKKDIKVAEKPNGTQPPPAFSLKDNAQVNLNRSPITGVPHGLFEGSGNSQFNLHETPITTISQYLDYTQPSERYTKFTKEQLIYITTNIISILRTYETLSSEEKKKLDNDVQELMSEVLNRVPRILRREIPPYRRQAIDALYGRYGLTINGKVANDAADYLGTLIKAIP